MTVLNGTIVKYIKKIETIQSGYKKLILNRNYILKNTSMKGWYKIIYLNKTVLIVDVHEIRDHFISIGEHRKNIIDNL